MEYSIVIDKEEAQFIDSLITLHSWDLAIYERLVQKDLMDIRKQIGKAIVSESSMLYLTDELMSLFLVVSPISYRFGQRDVGVSFKTKLYRAYLKIPLTFKIMEEKDDTETSNDSGSSNNTYTDIT